MLSFSPDCSENPPDFFSGDCSGKRDQCRQKMPFVSAPKNDLDFKIHHFFGFRFYLFLFFESLCFYRFQNGN